MKRHPIINKILAIAFAIGFMALTPITTYAETITIFDDLVPLADPAASEDVLSTDQTDVISVAALEENVIGTATWSFTSFWETYTKQANFYLVDENGAAADFCTGTVLKKEYSSAGTAIGADTITSTLGGLASTDAYTVEYLGLYTEATGGDQITDVKYQNNWKSQGWSVQMSGSSSYTQLNNNDDTISFYVRYKVTKNTGLTISDDTLTTDGRLAATFVATDDNLNADSISYTWSKSTDGGNTYTECEDKVYKISSSEEEEVITDNTINIVLDGGVPSSADATVTYKVEAFTTGEDGTKTSLGEATYDVKYYSQIINGSFETPDISGGCAQIKNADYPQVVWHATAIAKNTEIELVNCDSDHKSWVAKAYRMYPSDSVSAADGYQFAELNCEAEAALYQDVLTVKGQTLNYWFSHRARGSKWNSENEYDEMYLVIMPREIAMTAGDGGGEVDTQSELKTILGSAASDSGIKDGIYLTDKYAGTFVRKVESSDQSWTQYTGQYNVSSYATRFFFVASTTASGDVTVGNLLDNIGFSTDLPPVKENQAQMTVEKVISGLTQEQAQAVAGNIEITITATDARGNATSSAPFVGTIKGSDMSWTWNADDGTYVGTYDFGSQNIGTNKYIYTATENSDSSGLSVSGYILTPTKNITASDTAVKNADGTVTMRSKSNVKFTFNNSYSAKITNPDSKFDKTAEVDNYDNRTYTINLQAQKTELEVNVDQNTDPIDLVLVMDVSGSMLFATDLVKVDTSATLDTNTIYYTIDNDAKATVYRVVCNKGTWQKRDDSYESGSWTNVNAENLKKNSNLYLPKSGVKATRLSKFQETAKKLVNKLPDKSNVTLITFAKEVKSNNDYIIDSATKSSLCKAIDEIKTSGGTRQDLGLQAAKEKISNLDDSNKKFVVLLTDGCPNADNTSAETVVSNSEKYADIIKNAASIFTIGIDLDVSSAMGTAKKLLNNCASEPKDSFYYNVTGTKLDDAVTTITASMLQRPMYIKATTGNVTDIVDSRFYLLDDSGNKVTSSGKYTIGGISASVTVNEDGTTKIIWNGVALGKVSGSSCSPWTVSFKIQAKDDFLGGNLIATNGSDSGVDTNNDGAIDEKFPQPAVNVKPLDIEMGSKDEYVFLGDKFTVYQDKTTDTKATSGALNWLLKNITTEALQDTVTTQISDIISNIKSEGGYTYKLPYSYGSTEDQIGNIVFTFTPATDVSNYIGKDGEAKATTEDGTVATWKLSVQYKPLSTSDRQALGTAQGAYSTGKDPGTETAAEVGPKAEGTYTDHVVTLALNIQKNGLGSDGKTYTALGGAKFTLKNGGQKVDEGTSDPTTGLITFENLKTGTYTIKETEAPSGWALNDTEYTLTIAEKTDASADGDKLYNVKVTHGTDTDIDCTVNVTKQTATLDGKEYQLSDLSSLLTLTVTDQMAYELPHTGGSGIYIYTISGILLLMAAALLIYKQKNHK